MNDTLSVIAKRRAVRNYEPRPVPKNIIKKIIEAANQAPSGMNSQPWRFVVVTDKRFHKKLTKTAIPKSKKVLRSLKKTIPERYDAIMKRYDELEDPIYYSAPVIIFVMGTSSFADLSCPLACQNIMLAARSLGLGSCWVHFGSFVTDDKAIKKRLGLTKGEKIFGPIVVGYPKNFPQSPPKKKPRVKWI
jgi:nitroreductase